ncbi:hypothetical protein PUNSTDRAFT_122781 [Punctularia strigosozonata HHB-11173 SS5]|uniref:Uncharacterized protein n=1 Tax=Punctularia strigosozonata (strain HHB-11173) TaxID=741275 RepID=R7S3G9_PUNST|nr:uncharacterized protein PUNSTDRAFT_122781 [Punctularia strigosozonata HHB-11173 SS5]EIN04414.1 hypothetical protein PUNSTDRAFT_122781 [Punctularia strigosozonata HHB-11173 SS5]
MRDEASTIHDLIAQTEEAVNRTTARVKELREETKMLCIAPAALPLTKPAPEGDRTRGLPAQEGECRQPRTAQPAPTDKNPVPPHGCDQVTRIEIPMTTQRASSPPYITSCSTLLPLFAHVDGPPYNRRASTKRSAHDPGLALVLTRKACLSKTGLFARPRVVVRIPNDA